MPSNSRYGADLGGRSDPNPVALDGELPPLGANESLLGSHIALRSITNIGNTAGLLLSGNLPPTWTRYVDLTALTGASFLKHDRFELKYSGSAVFVPSSLPGSPVEGEFVYTAAGHQFQFWNGTAWVGLSSGTTGVASITGTANQVTVSPTTGNAIASLPATVILTTSIVAPLHASAAGVQYGFGVNGADWHVSTGGDLRAFSDNSRDLGNSGALRPRTGYFATSVVVGTDPTGSEQIRAGSLHLLNQISAFRLSRGTAANFYTMAKTNTFQIVGEGSVGGAQLNTPPQIALVAPEVGASADQNQSGGKLEFAASRSTIAQLNAGTFNAVVTGDFLGEIRFGGDDTVNIRSHGARIYAKAAVTWTSASHPADLYFATVPTGSTGNALDRWVVGQDGALRTATDPGGSEALRITGGLRLTTQLTSTLVTGTAPFVVASTTKVINLNADSLDDQSGAFYQDAGNLNAGSLAYARLPTGGGTWSNGGTLSITGGRTTVAGLTTSSGAIIDGAAGTVRDLTWQTGGVNRWVARTNATAEGGANAGSDFQLLARDDAGALLDSPITINRAITGAITLSRDVSLAARLLFTAASSQIIPGATSFAIRDTGSTRNDIFISNAGIISTFSDVNLGGYLKFASAVSRIQPGATSLALRNTADSADNLLLTDAGAATFRNLVAVLGNEFKSLTNTVDVRIGGESFATGIGAAGTVSAHDFRIYRNSVSKITVTSTLTTSVQDFAIGTLGTFDSTDTPLDGHILFYHAGSTNKWQAEAFQLIYDAGDSKVQVNADSTSVAYVYLDPGTGADSPAGAAPVPVIKLFKAHKAITVAAYASTAPDVDYHDGASFPADFRYFIYEYSIDNFVTPLALCTATSDKVVHGRLTSGTTYYYRVRAVDKFGNVSANSTVVSVAATAGSDTSAFGIILASEISVDRLAALSANVGIITAGQLRNTGNTSGVNLGGAGGIPGTWTSGINFESAAGAGSMTRYINFTATGANPVFKHELLSLNADGSAVFNGIVRDTSSKFTIDMSTAGVRLMTIIDEQGTPRTRVKLGEVNTGTSDWGLQIFADNGNKIVEMSGTTMFLQDSAASPTQGVNVQGTLPGTWTRYLNLNGSGALLHHDKLDLNYDGSAKFYGLIDITNPGISMPSGIDASIILRDPDVAHGMTSIASSDIFGIIAPRNNTDGGLALYALSDTDTQAFELTAIIGSASPTASVAGITVGKKNGSGVQSLADGDGAFAVADSGGTLYKLFGDGSYDTPEASGPGTPSGNFTRDYAKDLSGISKRYWKDDAGVEHPHNLTLIDSQTFTATGAGTWTKPAGAVLVLVVVVGAGGGGGGGEGRALGIAREGGGGGGGGAAMKFWFNAADLGSTEALSVGTGGTAGTGGTNANGVSGGLGGDTWYGNATQASAKLWAYGGGGGRLGNNGVCCGGTGGGIMGAGFTGVTTAAAGGAPSGGVGDIAGQGYGGAGIGAVGLDGNPAAWGGASGGGHSAGNNIGTKGGVSQYGGAGGGAGGGALVDNSEGAGGAGGDNDIGIAGGGGTAGAAHTAGGNGAAGDYIRSGQGGGGAGGHGSANGVNGGNGGAPGGGGGGGGGGTATGGNGGTGGRGEVRVYTYA